MNKTKNSKIVLVLSVFLIFLIIGSASAAEDTDEIGNETILTSTPTDVDTVTNTVDEKVSAAGNTDDIVGSEDTSNKLSLEESSQLSAGETKTFTDIKDLVSSGGIVDLKGEYYTYTPGTDPKEYADKGVRGIDLVSNTVINGNGAIIDANKVGRLFIMKNINNVTIKNVTYKNLKTNVNDGASGNGGYFARILNSTNIVIEDCIFEDLDGGDTLSAVISFQYIISRGNPESENITISNCNFTNIKTTWSGSAINMYAQVQNIIIKKCNFINNMCGLTEHGGGNGGAIEIYAQGATLDECNFINCRAGGNGGAITLGSNAADVTISNSYFENCTEANTGGAIAARDSSCKRLYIINTNFYNNQARNGAGAVMFNGADGQIINCTFENNTDGTLGGAVYTKADNLTVINSNFINNNAPTGGAVYYNAKYSTISYSNFTNNNANNGGAVYYSGSYCLLKDSIMINNNASDNGGAIYFSGSYCNLTNCVLEFNNASGAGGAVEFTGSFCNIIYCNFTNNTAGSHGGGVQFNGENSTMWYCLYVNNTCPEGDGGALCSNALGSTVAYCNFTNNTAKSGNDFFAHGSNTIKFIGLKFNILYLTNEYAEFTVTDGYGTGANRPAGWRNDTDYATGFLGEFLDTSSGKATIYYLKIIQ